MTREKYSAEVKAALAAFEVADVDADCDRYGNGHINDTFAVNGKDGKRYILHRVNHEVFTEPEKLMSNVEKVTQFLRDSAAGRRSGERDLESGSHKGGKNLLPGQNRVLLEDVSLY